MLGEEILDTYLSTEERNRFMDNVRIYSGRINYLTMDYEPCDLIGGLFIWSDTPEGSQYWFSISNRVGNYNKLRPKRELTQHTL